MSNELNVRPEVRKIIFAGVIAAVYAVLTFAFAPISFGALQFRISEVLAILPFFFPLAVPGLFVGCIIANSISIGSLGIADVIFGSTATLLSALCTMRIGKSRDNEKTSTKALACLPPVVINAIVIGSIISFIMVGEGKAESFWIVFFANMLQVALGQSVVLYLLGLPLLIYLPRMGVIDRLRKLYENGGKE